MIRKLVVLLAFSLFSMPSLVSAQETANESRAETGGAQTLNDILRRQQGEGVDMSFRKNATGNPDQAAATTSPLGTLGGASDPELWRSLRYGSAKISSQIQAPGATVLVQDGGMRWLKFREGPLSTWGGYFLLGMLVFLALFFLIRGRIRVDDGLSGEKVTRFSPVERFAHWLLAGSFILLAVSGLVSLFGRNVLIPLIGHDAFASLAVMSKWVHNNVAWAFILGLLMIFVMWVLHNLPDRTDINWIAKGGGMFSKDHPPAKKFNAGQKLIFWSVTLLGALITVTGLSLLFPFEIPLATVTAPIINALGLPGLFGIDALPDALNPHSEMQFTQLWHSISAFALIGVVLAHIYIGTLGMEGAYDAMGSGDVDLEWAKQHHKLWLEDLHSESDAAKAPDTAAPAE